MARCEAGLRGCREKRLERSQAISQNTDFGTELCYLARASTAFGEYAGAIWIRVPLEERHAVDCRRHPETAPSTFAEASGTPTGRIPCVPARKRDDHGQTVNTSCTAVVSSGSCRHPHDGQLQPRRFRG